ncbi:MAG TPA: hypothetical protein VN811_06020 [Thermoanaerobaculia bacterium]|nr:hypothetical protein [Thermoanaerobaculia bacterium]
MSSAAEGRRRRAEARASWPVRGYQLGSEPGDDLSSTTTPEQRLAMMWELALQAWQLAGHELPTYARHEIPGKLIRPAR